MKLINICDIVNIRTSKISNYISTENMLPNKGGVCEAANVPSGTVIEYKVGDILISNIRPYFQKIWRADRNGGCSADVLCIRAKENVDSKYLYYLLSQQAFFDYVMSGAKGCKMPRGDKKQIMQWPVNLPPLEEQRRIAGILGSLDDKIELNRRINANLEAQAQALFRSWFVDFEPFRDGPFVDSELGKIPQGWKTISLSELMNYAGGSQPPASEFINSYKDGYVRFIQIRDYASESHITYIPISSKNKTCDIRDIMIARYGASLGRICYGLKGAYNVALAKVLPVKPYYREFLRSYLSSDYFYQSINMKGNRAVQAGFNQSDINSFRLNFPKDESIIQTYDKVCSQFLNKRLQVLDEIKALSALRDTLLPKLMAGEIAIE